MASSSHSVSCVWCKDPVATSPLDYLPILSMWIQTGYLEERARFNYIPDMLVAMGSCKGNLPAGYIFGGV